MDCHRERNSSWAKENRERLTLKRAEWCATNPDKALETDRSWKAANKPKLSAQFRKWRTANKEYDCARAAARKAAKLRATPKWADLDAIAEIYRAKPAGHDVDHAVPLTSPFVCGLHCEANLQYLPSSENQSKRNFRWPDMPRIENAQRQSSLLDPYDSVTKSEQLSVLP